MTRETVDTLSQSIGPIVLIVAFIVLVMADLSVRRRVPRSVQLTSVSVALAIIFVRFVALV